MVINCGTSCQKPVFRASNLLQDPLIGDCFEDLRLIAEERLPEALKHLWSWRWRPEKPVVRTHWVVGIRNGGTGSRRVFVFGVPWKQPLSYEGRHSANLGCCGIDTKETPSACQQTMVCFVVAGIITSLFHRTTRSLTCHSSFYSNRNNVWSVPWDRPCRVFDKRFYDMDGEQMTNLIHRAFLVHLKMMGIYKMEELAWEIGADMFDLYFCMAGTWIHTFETYGFCGDWWFEPDDIGAF